MENEVQQDKSEHRFSLDLGSAQAFITYEERPSGELDLKHTEVPDEFQGKGVASQLVRGTLEIAKQNGNKVIATCPYIKTWITRHSEYQSMLAS